MLDGKKFGQYEVERKIGAGGMGEVYFARDTRLERSVAIKVLPIEACCDPEKEKRFIQEARTASALNHPNIITIYDIGKDDGRTYIATELVEGEVLRRKIDLRELTLLEAVEIAEQVASALSAAHEAGIIHRDIKPENIMIRKDGYAKVLDFGLAKMTAFSEVGAEDETIQLVKTQPGIVMGSVRYMSPEQARGKDVDERTDIWSLGVVLYEMIAGYAPFDGDSVSDTLANVIRVEPQPLPLSQDDASNELQRIIRRALQKNRDERYQTIRDFYLDLKTLRREIDNESTTGNSLPGSETQKIIAQSSDGEGLDPLYCKLPETTKTTAEQFSAQANLTESVELVRERRSRRIWQNSFLGFLVVAILGALAYFSSTLFSEKSASTNSSFSAAKLSRITNDGQTVMPAISPDGKYVAFLKGESGKQSLVVRQIATESSVVILPERSDFYARPVFSPDGNFVYYLTVDRAIGSLYKVPALGGSPRKIVTDVDGAPTFSPDGKRIAFLRNDPKNSSALALTADNDGGNLETIFDSREKGYMGLGSIAWSPDGEKLLVTTAEIKGGNVNEPSMFVAEYSFRKHTITEFPAGRFAAIVDLAWLHNGSGFLLNAKENRESPSQIWQVNYPSGEKSRVTNDVNDYDWLSISASDSNVVTIKSDLATSLWSVYPATKESKQLTAESKAYNGKAGFDTTADGKIIFTQTSPNGDMDISAMKEDGTSTQPLVTSAKLNYKPLISPDGRYIVFVSSRTGSTQIWRMDADGKNPLQLTEGEDYIYNNPQVSPDGKFVLFERMPIKGEKVQFARVSIDGGEATEIANESKDYNFLPRLSPDGKRIAFHTVGYTQGAADSKKVITVRDFVNGEITGAAKEYPFSTFGDFLWSPDGKSLTILNIGGVQNLAQLNLETGQTKPLTNFTAGRILNFAWTKDGKRLIVIRGNVSNDLVLIQNPAGKSS
jgi:serine/threonine protein kinase